MTRTSAALVLCTLLCLAAGAYCKGLISRDHKAAARKILQQDTGCHDLLNECAAWADGGLCEDGFSWHGKSVGSFLCKESCEACGGEEDASRTAEDEDDVQQESDGEEEENNDTRAAAASTRKVGALVGKLGRFFRDVSVDVVTDLSAQWAKEQLISKPGPGVTLAQAQKAFADQMVRWLVQQDTGYHIMVTFDGQDYLTPVADNTAYTQASMYTAPSGDRATFYMFWVKRGAKATFTYNNRFAWSHSVCQAPSCQILNGLHFY